MFSVKNKDIAIFIIMGIGAACGLIYEYLLSHYAGRVLGAIETVIFSMIGIMIVSMGVGSFLARYIKCPFTGFAWLEVIIAFLGVSAILIIGSAFSFSYELPNIIAETFRLPADLVPRGGMVSKGIWIAEHLPYVVGFFLGLLIGAEIPLIARVRQSLYKDHLENNTGDIYGVDYIGAGIGAAIWVVFMLSLEPTLSAAITATANLVVGFIFYILFYSRIKAKEALLVGHVLVSCLILTIGMYGQQWDAEMEDLLYRDKVVYSTNTQYQHLVITERILDPRRPPAYYFYINGRTQFSTLDEHIYHSMLTYPAMVSSARHNEVLIIGGGDGLALRDVLRWKPRNVTLLDLDEKLVTFFTKPVIADGREINSALLSLNENSLSDKRVNTQFGDAYLLVDTLIQANKIFDTIIVDLPDPSHPDLNKLYSKRFYKKLFRLLAGDGAISIQSTSPYYATDAFISIGKTLNAAGFGNVEQYHHNVPSFGEWGWTIATKHGASAKLRVGQRQVLPVDDGWTTKGKLLAAFEFSQSFYKDVDKVKINRLGSGVMYKYHHDAWTNQNSLFPY